MGVANDYHFQLAKRELKQSTIRGDSDFQRVVFTAPPQLYIEFSARRTHPKIDKSHFSLTSIQSSMDTRILNFRQSVDAINNIQYLNLK